MFAERRAKLMQDIPEGTVLVVPSNKVVLRNNDVSYPFYQNSDFLYLTGWEQPDALLLLSNTEEKFFCEDLPPEKVVWEGSKLGRLEAEQRLSMPVYPRKEIKNHLFDFNVFCSTQPDLCLPHDFNWQQYSLNMRVSKSSEEVGLIKQAIAFTIQGHKYLISQVREGISERALYGAWLSQMYGYGLMAEAYPAIIAAGVNSCTLHYTDLTSTCCLGDLLLIDAGMSYRGYAADLTRTVPVSGKFSVLQKQVYEQVLQIQLASEKFCQPGTSLQDLNKYVDSLYEAAIVELGFRGNVRKYAPHGIGHSLGLDVHDIGLDRLQPIPEGAVITIEPGLYFPEQAIGIRIEDNYLMTSSGLVCLSSDLPKSVSEIEKLCE